MEERKPEHLKAVPPSLQAAVRRARLESAEQSEADANQLSVRIELQADCFAGVWAHFTQQKGILEQGDIESALNAAKRHG